MKSTSCQNQKILTKKMESASSLRNTGTDGSATGANSEAECRPKRRKEDKGKARALAGSDSTMGEGSERV